MPGLRGVPPSSWTNQSSRAKRKMSSSSLSSSSSSSFLVVTAATAVAATALCASSAFSCGSGSSTVQAFLLPSLTTITSRHRHHRQRTSSLLLPAITTRRRNVPSSSSSFSSSSSSSSSLQAISPFQEHYQGNNNKKNYDDDEEEDGAKAAPTHGSKKVSGKDSSSRTSNPSSLNGAISSKFRSLLGSMASFIGQDATAATVAAAALAKTKGGAGGRGHSATITPGSPSTTTVSFLEPRTPAELAAAALANPCDSVLSTLTPTPSSTTSTSTTTITTPSRRPPSLSATDAALGKYPDPVNENIARISSKVPNTWLAVCHSADLKKKELKKVWVDEKPICLFRTSSGEVKAISDICLHRAAALSDGWLDGDLVVCPYHAYKFDGEGKLRYIPGVDEGMLAKNKRTARTVWYKTYEQGGLVYIFPDAMRAGSIEQHVKPFLIPEAVDPSFRVVEGVCEIKASANLVVENLLDMLHISYVHSFGNMQEPLPFEENYEYFYDDEASQLLPYARTTFKYRAGPTSISKVVGKIQEVVVENEFHLPYTTVTRVKFGKDVKTIYVVAVPVEEGLTVVHYKLYRNFMYVHPRDESIVNKGLDQFFQSVMRLTLNEDKEILESLYQEHQEGYVLSRYDKPLKIFRKTMKEFMEASKAREGMAERRALEMELLRLIERTERGRKATRGQHATILSIVKGLEKGFARLFEGEEGEMGEVVIEDRAVNGTWHLVYANPGDLSALPPAHPEEEMGKQQWQEGRERGLRPAPDATAAAAASARRLMTPAQLQAATRQLRQQQLEEGGSTSPPDSPRLHPSSSPIPASATAVAAPRSRRESDDVLLYSEEGSARLQERLRSAGGERYLLDFSPSKGRPLWADTDESTQTIDTANNLLSNTAVYQGLLGITTKVELNGVLSAPGGGKGRREGEEGGGGGKGHRQDVQFTSAKVDVGGFEVTFPHMDVFGVSGWLDTTFVDEHIRICRGNRGSVFVLTRRPLVAAGQMGKVEI